MGVCGSKKKSEDEEEEEEEDGVYDARLIFWDKHGNLRYGETTVAPPERQLLEVMELDYVDDEDGKKWYLVESAWLASWLAFVHVDKGHAPSPGPCSNERLIEWSPEENKYVGRKGLLMSSKDVGAGDFRRVSKETWNKYKEFYPESGPTITLEYNVEEMKEESYIGKHFVIVDPPDPPKIPIKKSKKRKVPTPSKAVDDAAVYSNVAAAEDDAEEEKDDFEDDESVFDLTTNPMTVNEPKIVSNMPVRNLAAEDMMRKLVGDDKYEESVRSESMASQSMSQSVSQSPYGENESFSQSHSLYVQPQAPPASTTQPRNVVAEQFARVAVEKAYEDTTKASDRPTGKKKGSTIEDIYYDQD